MSATLLYLDCPQTTTGLPVFHCPACGHSLCGNVLNVTRPCHHVGFTYRYDRDYFESNDQAISGAYEAMLETSPNDDFLEELAAGLDSSWLLVALESPRVDGQEDGLIVIGLNLQRQPVLPDVRADCAPFILL